MACMPAGVGKHGPTQGPPWGSGFLMPSDSSNAASSQSVCSYYGMSSIAGSFHTSSSPAQTLLPLMSSRGPCLFLLGFGLGAMWPLLSPIPFHLWTVVRETEQTSCLPAGYLPSS